MTPAAYILPFDSWSYKQNNSDSIICVICRCGEDEHNKGKLIKATAKGVESLRRYCGIRGDDAVKTFLTDEATIVHYHCNCRKECTNDRVTQAFCFNRMSNDHQISTFFIFFEIRMETTVFLVCHQTQTTNQLLDFTNRVQKIPSCTNSWCG